MVFLRRATGPTAGGPSGLEEAIPEERFLGQLKQKPPGEESSPAQGIENLSADEVRGLFMQLRHDIHTAAKNMQGNSWDESDKNWFLDEWQMGVDGASAPQSSWCTLTVSIDRPIVINSILATLPTSATGGYLYIGPVGGMPASNNQLGPGRIIEFQTNTTLFLSNLQMIVLPTEIFRVVAATTPTSQFGFFVEIMGAYMRNSEWRRF